MNSQLETTMIAVGSKAGHTGGVLSISGLVLSNETVALIGVGVAVTGVCMQSFFNFRKERREERLMQQQSELVTQQLRETALRISALQDDAGGKK